MSLAPAVIEMVELLCNRVAAASGNRCAICLEVVAPAGLNVGALAIVDPGDRRPALVPPAARWLAFFPTCDSCAPLLQQDPNEVLRRMMERSNARKAELN
jgi:hypothetical protein